MLEGIKIRNLESCAVVENKPLRSHLCSRQNTGSDFCEKMKIIVSCSGAGRRWFAVQSAEGAAAAAAHAAPAIVVVGGAPNASSETAGARRVADVAPPLAAGTEFSFVRSLALSLRLRPVQQQKSVRPKTD
jgi:hypothetical protein